MSIAAHFSLAGKVALVTGGGQGLGQAMAEALAEAGAKVALFDRDAGPMAEVAAALTASGAQVSTHVGDVTDAEALERVTRDIVALWGALDVVVANAGVSEAEPGLFHEMDRADWDRVMAVNLDGVYNTLRPALTQMMGQGSGKVILLGSMFGLAGAAGIFPRPAYSASKGAVVNLTRELGLEYAPHGIQVNALVPGFIRTPTRPRSEDLAKEMAAYTPMGRLGQVEDIKGATVFLAAPSSDFMTGQMVVVDGGILAR